LKKDLRFLFVSSLGATVLLSRLGGEKNESDGPEALDSSSPRLLAVFAEENSWSRSLKKAKKKSVWLFPLLYIRGRAAQE